MALHSTSEQEMMFLYGPVRRRNGRWSGPAGSGAHLHAKAARRQVVRRQGRKALTRELTEVMDRKQKLALAIRSQFRQPRGFVGWLVRWEMALRASNRQRNVWAVGLLGVEPTDRVLEIGFGPGIAIRELSRRATHGLVYGVDHSAVMVRQATQRGGRACGARRAPSRCGRAAADMRGAVRQGLSREHHGHVARARRRVAGGPSPHAAWRTDRDRVPAAVPRRHGGDDRGRRPRDCGPSHRSGLHAYPVGHPGAHAPVIGVLGEVP